MQLYSVARAATILTNRLKARGIRRIIEPQVVRLAIKHGVLPSHTVADKIVLYSDELDGIRVKVAGTRQDPIFYRVPAGYDDCLISDEVAAGLQPAVAQSVARRWMRAGNFPRAFCVRRNWLLPVTIVDGQARADLALYGRSATISIGLNGKQIDPDEMARLLALMAPQNQVAKRMRRRVAAES